MPEKSQREPTKESGELFSQGLSRAEAELSPKSDSLSLSEIRRQIVF